MPIDLTTYSIQLVEENGQKTVIQLEGIVPSKDVYVISNFTSNIGIQTVSDALDLLLSFEGKVAIELTKGSGEIIDKIGRQGIETTSDVINFEELLNNPNYLNYLDVNLGSLENLLIRRKGIVQRGNVDFSNEDLLKEWVIMPNFEISDLGHHLNACQTPMIYWSTGDPNEFGVDQFEPEKRLYENEGGETLLDVYFASNYASHYGRTMPLKSDKSRPKNG